MNWKEDRVLRYVAGKGSTEIRPAARKCFPGFRPVQLGDRQVRNAARKLGKLGLVDRKRGELAITDKGREYVSSNEAVRA